MYPKFKTLLYDIPIECMKVSEEIISYAKLQLGKKLNDSIYVSLTDHITLPFSAIRKGWISKRLAVGNEAALQRRICNRKRIADHGKKQDWRVSAGG